MNILKWAEKEFELAGEDLSEEAQEAFRALVGDDRPDWYIMEEVNILARLANRLPITPITENDDFYGAYESYKDAHNIIEYRCMRYPSLRRRVFANGSSKYYDNSRFVYYDVKTGKRIFIEGYMAPIMSYDIFPITFPYYPEENQIKVFIKQFGVENRGIDTIGVYTAECPSGKEIVIDRFYKWSEKKNTWVEISYLEYLFRTLVRRD